MDYGKICLEVQKIAREAGQFIRQEGQKLSQEDIELKSVANLVTYVDKTSEQKIVDALSQLIPGSGFIAEEGTGSYKDETYKWIIDPLDGTTNFVHGLAPHSVSIALTQNDKLVMGVVYEIVGDEMFYAWSGSPAYLNGQEISVTQTSEFQNSLIATGFPYYDFDRINNYIEALRYLMQNTRGLRRMGSAAADLAYLAAGRFDAFFEHALHAWDIAAAAFILQQAGGKISDFNGGDNWLFGGEIIAANGDFFDTFYQTINSYLGNKETNK